jgi:hypothetical protein
MVGEITFKIDFTQFDRALRQYMGVTTRTLLDVLNKKAYFVARRALFETPATSKETITSSLGTVIRSKKGVKLRNLAMTHISLDNSEAPRAALIINSLRKAKSEGGQGGLYGAAMTDAIALLISARNKSRAYLKSGWLPALKILRTSFTGSTAGAAPMDRTVVQFGGGHGTAEPAKPGMVCTAKIENSANPDTISRSTMHAPTHNPDALVKFGGPALQRAFDKETADMLAEVARRQYEAARAIGIKAVGG